MKKIKFSHVYQKFAGIESNQATLLAVFKTTKAEMHPAFVRYDTTYFDDLYEDKCRKLPIGELLVLLFLTRDGRLFTTIRANTQCLCDREQYYRSAVGEVFQVEITR